MNTPTIMVYGIAHCDSVKKARAWLSDQGLPYVFHDFKKQGLPPERLQHWMSALGWEPLLNRRGTTWRTLDAATQARACDAASAAQLLLAHPSLVRRPVVEWGHGISLGFQLAEWNEKYARSC